MWSELCQLKGIKPRRGLCDIDINILMTISAVAQDTDALMRLQNAASNSNTV